MKEPLIDYGDDDLFDYGQGWPGVFAERNAYRSKKVDIIETMYERQKYSPDFYKLRRYKNILIFVYDRFMSDGNSSMEGAKYLGRGVTSHDMFTMKGFRFPILFNNTRKESPLRGRVKGEVYAISPEMLLTLDKHKKNGVLVERVKRPIILKDQTVGKENKKHPTVICYTFIGIDSMWESDHLPTMPMYSYGGSVDRKYFEFVPTQFASELDRRIG